MKKQNTKNKFIVKCSINSKRQQFSRNTIESARGIAQNCDRANIYEKMFGKQIKVDTYRKGKFLGISIKDELKIAKLKVNQK